MCAVEVTIRGVAIPCELAVVAVRAVDVATVELLRALSPTRLVLQDQHLALGELLQVRVIAPLPGRAMSGEVMGVAEILPMLLHGVGETSLREWVWTRQRFIETLVVGVK
jgi:hypothetical protein